MPFAISSFALGTTASGWKYSLSSFVEISFSRMPAVTIADVSDENVSISKYVLPVTLT